LGYGKITSSREVGVDPHAGEQQLAPLTTVLERRILLSILMIPIHMVFGDAQAAGCFRYLHQFIVLELGSGSREEASLCRGHHLGEVTDELWKFLRRQLLGQLQREF
jgi:hypothetical protein